MSDKKEGIEEVVQSLDDVEAPDDVKVSQSRFKIGKARKRRGQTMSSNGDEYIMSDTFDFRQYLPQDLLNDDNEETKDDFEEEDKRVDSEEEEIANAIMEDGFAEGRTAGFVISILRKDSPTCGLFRIGEIDSDEDDHKNGRRGGPKLGKKATKRGISSSETEAVISEVANKRTRRRGVRRSRRKYSAIPRVNVLDRQETAEEVRERADDFINQRLYNRGEGRTTGQAKSFKGPRRMDQRAVASMSKKPFLTEVLDIMEF
ncbi:unnamed protein product [Mesocestoides corti]|uniref:Uncharacterized protein n=1 Tax=Mesocestoides corti TaxID=53468 RepID=A0A0R3UQM7_MESCO|nr:unnamed protein product [Mesocestoides corti]